MALLSQDNKLEFRQYTIERTEDYKDDYKKTGKLIYLNHKKWGFIQPFLYDDEINLLLGLLGCSEDELIGKEIIAACYRGENIAVGYKNTYFRLYRDEYSNRNEFSKLLSLDQLRASLENIEVAAYNRDEEEVDISDRIMNAADTSEARRPRR